MTDMAIGDREFGEMTERVRGIQEDLTDLRTDVHGLKGSIAEISSTLSSVKGGWKAIAAIASLAAAAGGIVVKVIPLLLGHA